MAAPASSGLVTTPQQGNSRLQLPAAERWAARPHDRGGQNVQVKWRVCARPESNLRPSAQKPYGARRAGRRYHRSLLSETSIAICSVSDLRAAVVGCGSARRQALDRLAGDVRDDLEVLVKVQHRQPCEFGGSGDDQVRDRGGAVLASIGEQRQHLDGSVFNRGCLVFNRHGGQRRPT